MINKDTPQEIATLGQTVSEASLRLEAIFRELSVEADSQMAQAAQAFINEHAAPSRGLHWVPYIKAHEALLTAAVAASNIRELMKRSTTLRSKCDWWAGLDGRGQEPSDIRRVCEKTAAADASPAQS